MKSIENIDQLLARDFAKEPMTAIQQAELQVWIEHNKEEYEHLQILLSDKRKVEEETFDSAKAWLTVEPKLEIKKKVNTTYLYKVATFAASIAVLIGLVIFFTQRDDWQGVTLANNSVVSRIVTLPDSSMVTLYPNSKIVYKGYKSRGKRLLTLSGKAFFDIRRNVKRPFVIQAYNVQVEVLGTSFLIDAKAENRANVFVKSGTVKVTADEKKIILQANQQATVADGKIIKGEIRDEGVFFGNEVRTLNLVNTPIVEVISELEQVYNVKIELDQTIKNNRITTRLKLNELDPILVELSYICKCKYKKIAEDHYKLYHD
ncbi:FecR family protein [Bacteroides neonati]|uniref:FecR family protein n=1 Tax=Bacteroides neonati TaxID=1347393 RepID=UPI0004AEA125|nr:FecR domain-containing protein [Bacteroides neonati]